ncbi:MAG: ferredoxin--NADP(+) reductase, partial [Candidatus Omnitrophica bacterium]|nr:ferredoxin--NADP(+) reductase [Candidatus Omnitrophota bacterium]
DPVVGEVIENKRLTPGHYSADNDVRHMVIRPRKLLPYVPGQSVGILVPGLDPISKKPHKPRLYSVASERTGDLGDGETLSICVVRHFWKNPTTGEVNIPGLVSNYLCDFQEGETLRLTGPVGRHFLVPEDFKSRDFIFAATGTGIAPYRGMLKEMFDQGYSGEVSLYFGVQYHDVVLYDDEFRNYEKKGSFRYVTAISREEKNQIPNVVPTRENRMYVQVKMYQDREYLKKILAKPDSMVYICGLKGMEAGIFPVLEKIGQELGVSDSFVAKLKAERRLKVEVY